MLLRLIPLGLFATTVLADGASILAAMAKISSATVALNNTVASFPAGPLGLLDVIPLLSASSTLLSDINSGTKVAEASANLTLAETISVAGATQTLVSTVQSTLNTVMAAKAKFTADLLISPIILLNLKEEKAATDKFSAAVISKVPTAYQGLAANIVAPIDTAFNAAIADYTGAI